MNKRTTPRLLDSVDMHMPALQCAVQIQKLAARSGFDWQDANGVLAKIDEELDELKAVFAKPISKEELSEELGDVLFCCISLARHHDIDPELILRQTNAKFLQRFNYIEDMLLQQNKSLASASLEEMDTLWDEAKAKQRK